MSKITIAEFMAIVREKLPFAVASGAEIVALDADSAVARLPFSDDFLRPGGTIGGPSLMSLADFVMYALVMAAYGPVELAVTSSLSISFLRKPPPGDIRAEAAMLRRGRRLAYGDVKLYGGAVLVAHATVTYALPSPEVS